MNSRDLWLMSRPPIIRQMAKEFPEGMMLQIGLVVHYVIGWNENDKIICSPVNPAEDYDLAIQEKCYVCASHFREAVKKQRVGIILPNDAPPHPMRTDPDMRP